MARRNETGPEIPASIQLFRSQGKELDRLGRQLAQTDKSDDARRRMLWQQIRLTAYAMYFPAGSAGTADIIRADGTEEKRWISKLEDKGRAQRVLLKESGAFVKLSEARFQDTFLPVMDQLGRAPSAFDPQKGSLSRYVLMALITRLGQQILDNRAERSRLWLALEQRWGPIEGLPAQESAQWSEFLNDPEAQKACLQNLHHGAGAPVLQSIAQVQALWGDVAVLASTDFPFRSISHLAVRIGEKAGVRQLAVTELERTEAMDMILKEARRRFRAGAPLYHYLDDRFLPRLRDVLRRKWRHNPQDSSTVSIDPRPSEGSADPSPANAPAAQRTDAPSPEFYVFLQETFYELAALVMSLREKTGRAARPYPYYRVFFTSDLMSYLTQVEPGRASFRHQRDIERAILFAFVNFCAVQPCRRLDDIRRMEPKTYGAVLGERAADYKRERQIALPTGPEINAAYLAGHELGKLAYETVYDGCRNLFKAYQKERTALLPEVQPWDAEGKRKKGNKCNDI